MKRELYIYGSENPKANGKCHIADELGIPLCGAKIKFGEVTACIEKAVPDNVVYKNQYKLYVSAFGGGNDQRLDESYGWTYAACKSCEKHLKQILIDHYI